jgi:energy coupling factor transporter S component ThiW
MKTKKIALSGILIALGVSVGHIFYIPVGVARCFPMQHFVNVISAVVLGPYYAIGNALIISILRNILGVGSLLAFPGSMIGAALASVLYKKSENIKSAIIGELIGTGLIGSIVSYPVASFIMGKEVAVFAFVIPFFVSSLSGVLIAGAFLSAPAIKNQLAMYK